MLLPSLITGAIALYFFKLHLKDEAHQRNSQLLKAEKNKASRFACKRTNALPCFWNAATPTNCWCASNPWAKTKQLIAAFCSKPSNKSLNTTWPNRSASQKLLRTLWFLQKNATVQLLHEMATDDGIPESQDLREILLKKTFKTPPPSAIALSTLKSEVLQLL